MNIVYIYILCIILTYFRDTVVGGFMLACIIFKYLPKDPVGFTNTTKFIIFIILTPITISFIVALRFSIKPHPTFIRITHFLNK